MLVQDPVLIFLASQFSSRGHPQLPLRIAKEKQSYVVGHERKRMDGSAFIEEACKLTFVKSSGVWKLFWKRADLKWHLYDANKSLEALVTEIKQDPRGCFWG